MQERLGATELDYLSLLLLCSPKE